MSTNHAEQPRRRLRAVPDENGLPGRLTHDTDDGPGAEPHDTPPPEFADRGLNLAGPVVSDLPVPADDLHPDRTDEDEDGGPEDGPVVYVDLPDRPARADRAGRGSVLDRARSGPDPDRRPLVPPWLRTHAERVEVAKYAARRTGYTSAYHALRTPKYAGRLIVRSPRGAFRVLARTGGWVFDRHGSPIRAEAVRQNNFTEYRAMEKLRNDKIKARLMVVVPCLVLLTVAVLALVFLASPLVQAAAVAVAVVVLGLLGKPADKPLFDVAVVRSSAQKLTSDVVKRAFASLGIAEVNKAVREGGGVTFPAPIVRDGPGWRAEVDLPHGVTAEDILDRRTALASGLRRPLGCVWPEPVHDAHAGRVVVWVGDRDMASAKPSAWPLAKSGRTDLFEPVPFGVDQRGRRVSVTLMFESVLIGSKPRMGKTFALRVLALGAALDPLCELWLFDLKGTGDLSPLEPVAHRYACGADDETAAAALDALRDGVELCAARAKTIAGLPRSVCPESKVTPELARQKALRLHPVFLAIDECQDLFTHPEYRNEAKILAEKIVKRGPAMGIIAVFATQRPDAASLPPGVSSNAGIRFCLRVMGQVENDMTLGTSSYKNGLRATAFTRRDKGIGYLVGASDDAQIVRGDYIDAPAADTIVVRARALRETAGTLAGHAVGEATGADRTGQLLDDLATATAPRAGEPAAEKVWSETVCRRLADLRPAAYSGWNATRLAAEVVPLGIGTGQVWGKDEHGKERNRKGIARAAILAALERHRATHGTSHSTGQGGPDTASTPGALAPGAARSSGTASGRNPELTSGDEV